MQYGGGPINWDSERGRPSDMRQWAQMQKQWSTEKAGPALPLWTAEQLRAAGVRTAQPMSFGQADQQFRSAATDIRQYYVRSSLRQNLSYQLLAGPI